jgi:hypothetical protein
MLKCPLGRHCFAPNRVSVADDQDADIAYCFGDVHVYRSAYFVIDCTAGCSCPTLLIRDESTAIEWALFEAVARHAYGDRRAALPY